MDVDRIEAEMEVFTAALDRCDFDAAEKELALIAEHMPEGFVAQLRQVLDQDKTYFEGE